MPCYRPIQAWHGPGGITFKRRLSFGTPVELPCGRCVGCRLDKSRDWAIRCYHEASMYNNGLNNAFITLTYSQENLPNGSSLVKSHFQKFIRSLRKRTKKKIRYYMCGEYGPLTDRPHYHALLFGFHFEDQKLFTIRRGNNCYKSALLEKTWTKGASEIGNVTFQSAGYVSRYIMSKQNGEYAEREYSIPDPETGEILPDVLKQAPYTQMSLHPGIGKEWYDKFKTDLWPHDYAVLPDGAKAPVPTYYRNLLKKSEPELWNKLRDVRIEKCENNPDNTPERLAVREVCKNTKAERLIRNL